MSEPTQEADWSLRLAAPQDEAFLENLFCQVHAGDFAGVPLPEQQVLYLIRMQARAQRTGYLRDFPSARNTIVMEGTTPIGRFMIDVRNDAIRVVDIAILPERQRRGVGTKLLQDLQQQARERGVPLLLTVQPQNPALRLYSRLGFQVTNGGTHLSMEWNPDSGSCPIHT